MKPVSIDALWALLLAVVLQGSFASSTFGGTPRHSRLRWAGTSTLQKKDGGVFGYKAFEHGPSSNSSSHEFITDRSTQEESEQMEARGISLMLMGGVAFQIALFYMVNSPHPGVILTTWRVLSKSSSIFMASLLYHIMCMSCVSDAHRTQMTLIIFLTSYVVSTLLVHLRFLSASAESSQALAMMFGHVASFAAMSFGLHLQDVLLFNGSNLKTGLSMSASTVLVAFILALLALCVNQVNRLSCFQLDKKRFEQCQETQDGIFCLCVSFLMVAVICFCIRGDVEDYTRHTKLVSVTQAHANQLLLWGSISGAAASLGTCIMRPWPGFRLVNLVLQLLGLISAWALLFWGKWQLQLRGLEGPSVSGSLLVAFSLTIFNMFAIFALSYVANRASSRMLKRSLESLELALGLLVGFAWQMSFAVALEDNSTDVHEKPSSGHHNLAYIFAVLLLVVGVPAWRCFILPRALSWESMNEAEEESLEKSLQAAAGKAVKCQYGTLKEQRAALGWQSSSLRTFSVPDVVIL